MISGAIVSLLHDKSFTIKGKTIKLLKGQNLFAESGAGDKFIIIYTTNVRSDLYLRFVKEGQINIRVGGYPTDIGIELSNKIINELVTKETKTFPDLYRGVNIEVSGIQIKNEGFVMSSDMGKSEVSSNITVFYKQDKEE